MESENSLSIIILLLLLEVGDVTNQRMVDQPRHRCLGTEERDRMRWRVSPIPADRRERSASNKHTHLSTVHSSVMQDDVSCKLLPPFTVVATVKLVLIWNLLLNLHLPWTTSIGENTNE